jgi:hypothetical protein
MAYDIDFIEEAVIKDHIKSFLLYPLYWSDINNRIQLKVKWNSILFNSNNLSHTPDKKGIYAFILQPSYENFLETKYLFYVGKTNRTLKIRYKEYLDEKEGKGKPRKKVHKMLNQYEGFLHFYWAEIGTVKNVNKFEENIINTFLPHINVSIPKAKIKNELKYIYEQN